MRKILVISVCCLVSVNIFAETKQKDEQEIIKRCFTEFIYAQVTMEARQEGATQSFQMDIGNNPSNEYSSEFRKETILDAYKQPEYSTQSQNEKQVQEFASKHYSRCVDTYK
ncbi:hypothetical protein [Acinetobacter stercoris]|nr:hypothetical protein [Acinetobacter stercoris]